jgi:tripartite ATP-independent transporter DctP family solute receptor
MPENHPYHNFAMTFAEEVKKGTDGKVEIDIFPGAQLGSESAMTDGVRIGTLDFVISTTGNSSSLLPRMGIMGMPFMYESGEHALAVAKNGDLLKYYQDIVHEAGVGIELLAFAASGPRHVYSTVPIKSIGDIKGLKIRTQTSPIEVEVWRALGAIPTSMPFSEIYTALQTGLVKAAENCPTSYVINKHSEVAPYYVKTENSWMMHPILVSEMTLNKVDVKTRQVFYDAAKVAAQTIYDAQKISDDKNLEDGIKAGVKWTDTIDRKPFMDIVIPIQNRFAQELKTQEALELVRSLATSVKK